MKRLMKRALTFGALLMMLASALPAGAQSVTSVKLKDGTVIRGQVQRTENGVNVTTEDGVFVYSNDELWLTKAEKWGKPHGFQASVGAGFHYLNNGGDAFTSGGPEILLGYRFKSFFMGLGAGYNFVEVYIKDCYIDGMKTVYLQGNYYFLSENYKFQPYVGMMLGWDFYGRKDNVLIRGLLGFEYRFARIVSLNMRIGPGAEVGDFFSGFAFTGHVGLTFYISK